MRTGHIYMHGTHALACTRVREKSCVCGEDRVRIPSEGITANAIP